MNVKIGNETAANAAARVAEDAGMAAMLGGNLFARVAMHPALEDVTSKFERGRVTNRAWRRYGAVNLLGLTGVVAGWAGSRPDGGRGFSERERTLAKAKDAAVIAVAVTGLASAAEGMRFASLAPGGAVPLEDGSTPAPETPPKAARAKRILNVLGALNGAAALALVGVNAALGQTGFRRPPARRLLWRGT